MAKTKPARYQNIDTATNALGYGTLAGEPAKRHAYGLTTAGANLWLPIMYDPDNNWYNMYGSNTSRELIIQIAHKKPAINEWHPGVLVAETARVIVRTNKRNETYEYEDIGEYCAVLFDSVHRVTIYAKRGASVTSGRQLSGKHSGSGFTWVSGFAASEDEARNKLDALAGQALKMLREC
jgi:hypothetical protein